jgi:transcriptional regulator with XRE-family HTH domain
MDPNQVVAYNLARARQLRGWTQDEAAAALEPYLGVRWSNASWSQAERSVGGKFVRRFDAEEIVAFARAFELPVTWFFLPPPAWKDGAPVKLTVADARRFGADLALLVDLVFGDDADQRALLDARLAEFFDVLGSEGLTTAQERTAGAAALRRAAVVRHHLGDVQQWEGWLRTLADHLADVDVQTRELAGDRSAVVGKPAARTSETP